MPTCRTTLLTLTTLILLPLCAVLYTLLTSPPATMSAPPSRPIIVVGAGLAGLSASLSALRAGAPVVHVLERGPKPGGNSIKASSGISAAGTRFQQQQHPPPSPPDSPDLFYNDTVRSAGTRLRSSDSHRRERRERLIRVLTDSSAAAVEDFLADELGVDVATVARLGGHSAARTHRGGGKIPPGAAIMSALLAKLREDYPAESGRFVIDTSVEVTSLLLAGGSSSSPTVTGVEFVRGGGGGAKETLLGPVIFASGGFAGDARGLLARYRPDLAGLPSTNDARPGAHDVLAAAGAELVDMDSVQVHPTGFVDPADPGAGVKFLAAEMLRGEGGVLLFRGKRFVNELDTREVVSGRIMRDLPPAEEEGGLRQWDVQLLLDPGAAEAAAGHVGFYLWKGLLVKKKVSELDETTRKTLEEYARVVRGEAKDEFGRTSFGHWKLDLDGEIDPEAEVCVGRVTPITHFTMGGALINEKSQVLAAVPGDDESTEKPINGLWAAGEITGGIHGDNRLGGSSLLECVVFGRIAGEEAAKAALAR